MARNARGKTATIPVRPADRGLSGPDQELAALTKALGHPVRIAILRLLRRRGTCICGDIVDELPVAQATVSQHLKVLKEAGFIKGEIDGPRVCYCEDQAALVRVRELLEELRAETGETGK
jgi:ArsR family transcriptional regulator